MFIVTVPHFACGGERARASHTCDIAAGDAAEALAASLRARGADVVGPIRGDTSRAAVDLNRAEGRATAWRTSLASRIESEARRGSPVCVVDVHSYDAGAVWDTAADEGGRPRPTLVFLDGRPHPSRAGDPEALRALLPSDWRRTVEVGGSPLNDIVHTAGAHGAAAAILIEFSEDMAEDRAWLDSAAGALAWGLVEMMQDLDR